MSILLVLIVNSFLGDSDWKSEDSGSKPADFGLRFEDFDWKLEEIDWKLGALGVPEVPEYQVDKDQA